MQSSLYIIISGSLDFPNIRIVEVRGSTPPMLHQKTLQINTCKVFSCSFFSRSEYADPAQRLLVNSSRVFFCPVQPRKSISSSERAQAFSGANLAFLGPFVALSQMPQCGDPFSLFVGHCALQSEGSAFTFHWRPMGRFDEESIKKEAYNPNESECRPVNLMLQ